MQAETVKISINGTVQGVGFRPFVYQLAHRFHLLGSVSNGTGGVEIYLNASPVQLQTFLHTLEEELPDLASVDSMKTERVSYRDFDSFTILSSDESGMKTVRIPPDVSICARCEQELFDPENRRYHYPFITCTHCGVRYTIIENLPYDRKYTSMKFFSMCQSCQSEYDNPLDRRYHAQPIGCWECGPKLSLWEQGEKRGVKSREAVDVASQLLLKGKILAVKGVGGYHLVCDATNEEAVAKMRVRKRRPAKPYALMVKDRVMAESLAYISEEEMVLLESKERPIVLLSGKEETVLAKSVSPRISTLGIFLPYTPLHLLLLEKLDRPLVATSANITDEPICTDMDALSKLSGVYDYVLDHDRKIVNGCDDSVVMVVKGEKVTLRRARGYAPASIKLPFSLPHRVLAMGANQKSTIAIAFEDQAILSPHIGDLDSIGSVEYYKKNIETLERLYDFKAEVIAYDKHPNYESVKVAKQRLTLSSSLLSHPVQHHYAHILGVMAEKQLRGRVLGVAFDGTGYGEDDTLWGGEFLLCDYEKFERLACIKPFKLLGGAKAIKEPKRVALSLLFDCYGEEALVMQTATTGAFSKAELKTQFIMWQKGLNAPLSSSAGRLFDAVASLTDVCQTMSFEGESGMQMEALYDGTVQGAYPFEIKNGEIDILPMIAGIAEEKEKVTAIAKFFHTLVEIVRSVVRDYDVPVVLSGGVFQNKVLLSLLREALPDAVISNDIPPNDGGIALGQCVSRCVGKENI